MVGGAEVRGAQSEEVMVRAKHFPRGVLSQRRSMRVEGANESLCRGESVQANGRKRQSLWATTR